VSGAAVLAASGIDISPNASGLPGSSTLVSLLGGLQFDTELVVIAAIIIGAGVWAACSHSNNYQGASRGKTAVIVSVLAGLLAGFGPALVEWFFSLGQSAH
jgi:hypothetical protein